MRAIHLVLLDKVGPALVLTRAIAVPTLIALTAPRLNPPIPGVVTQGRAGPRPHPAPNCARP